MQLPLPIFVIFTTFPSTFLGITVAAVTCGYGPGGSKVAQTVVVDKSGAGNFKTVQAAVDSIPADNSKWFKIQIKSGTYQEKVTIPKNRPCIFLQGQGRGVTKITFYAHRRMDTSATFTSYPDNVVAKGITFENSYNLGRIGRRRRVIQALSARIYGDKSAFYECGFLGLQDTLWDVQGRHYFYKSYVEGAIDFIFGDGQSLYEDCWVHATTGSLARQYNYGVITAQGRYSENDPSGFVFLRGQVTSTGRTLLGRGYGNHSRVIFQNTNLLANVVPYAWNPWKALNKEYLLTYAEEGCKGPGSDKSKRVPWEKHLTPSDLNKFSKSNFIDQDGWIAAQP